MPKISPKASATPIAVKAPAKGDHVFLVDGSSYIFRAYHALPPLNRKSDGLQVNAVLGFCNMLWKLLREMPPDNRPTHLAIVFDKSEITFRNKLYPDYKAHRPPAPDDLIPQFALIREAVRAFDLPCLEQVGFEADDLIATYVREACERDATATIVSSDKDLMQLVTDCVTMYDTMKDRRIGIPEVLEKFGVPPAKVVDVQALLQNSKAAKMVRGQIEQIQLAELEHDLGHATGEEHANRRVTDGAVRQGVHQPGNLAVEVVPVVHCGPLHPGVEGDGRRVQQQVRAPAERREHRQRVLERRLRQNVRRANSAIRHVDQRAGASRRHVEPDRLTRGRERRVRQTQPERLADDLRRGRGAEELTPAAR